MQTKRKQTIGRVELVSLPGIVATPFEARIDTGARTSSIGIVQVKEEQGVMYAQLLCDETGVWHRFDNYRRALITTSSGICEERFVVSLSVRIAGRTIRTRASLANRSRQRYPMLVGRNLLRGKFIVDVQSRFLQSEVST